MQNDNQYERMIISMNVW